MSGPGIKVSANDDIKKDNYYFFLQGDPFDHSAKIIDKINNVHVYGKSLFYHLGDLICIDCDRVSSDRVSYYKKAHSTFLLQHASQANAVSIHNKDDMLFCNVILTKDIKLKLIYEHFVQQSKDRIHLYESLFHNAPSVFNWSEGALFLYLVVLAVLIRTLITFFETPSSALMPELTGDYDERTTIQAWRSFFGWAGGAGMAVFMYAFLLVPSETYPVGALNRDGYETYGVISGGVILVAILVSALGTHHCIGSLTAPPWAPTPRWRASLWAATASPAR